METFCFSSRTLI